MAAAKVDGNGGGFGSKRSRNEVSVREGDWACPKCGNVNFSFRNVCNRGACGAPRPSPSLSPQRYPTIAAGYGQHSPFYYGGRGAYLPMAFSSGSYGTPYSHMGLQCGYGASIGPPGSYGVFSSYGPPGQVGGMVYGPGPGIARYGYGFRASPMPVSSPWSGGSVAHNNDSNASRKRRGGPDGLSEGDWVCPKCENVNFSFRIACNMKKCGAPRPTSAGGAGGGMSRSKGQHEVPEGSWTCSKCNNLNYPFRTMCNRKGCGAERPPPTSN